MARVTVYMSHCNFSELSSSVYAYAFKYFRLKTSGKFEEIEPDPFGCFVPNCFKTKIEVILFLILCF